MKRIKIKYNAPVVLTFVLLCFGVTLLGELTHGSSTDLLFMTYHSSLSNPFTYIRFFTHVLGHDGWEHFIGNSIYILLLGPMLEEKYGSKEIFEIIVITAAITGITNYIFFADVALCGASGVVFAFIVLASFCEFREGEIPLTFILVITVFLGQQIYEGIALQDNISHVSHILGGIVGAFVGYRLNKKEKYGL